MLKKSKKLKKPKKSLQLKKSKKLQKPQMSLKTPKQTNLSQKRRMKHLLMKKRQKNEHHGYYRTN